MRPTHNARTIETAFASARRPSASLAWFCWLGGRRATEVGRAARVQRGAPRRRDPSSAVTRACAFARVGSTKMSRSAVARGRPFAASACAPTTRKRTRFKLNKRKNSFQSWGRSIDVDPWAAAPQRFDSGDACCDGLPCPIESLFASGLLGRGPHDLFHSAQHSAFGPAARGQRTRPALTSRRVAQSSSGASES